MAEVQGVGERRYWVQHDKELWLPRSLLRQMEDKIRFKQEDPGDGTLEFVGKKLDDFQVVLPEQEEGVDDVCTLTSVNDAALLHCIRVRYFKDIIYTGVARTLIAVNPFKVLPLYAQDMVDKYMAMSDPSELPPHIFGLCQDAINGLRSKRKDQAVLISGESGAGKTESAKLILSFTTEASRSEEGGLEEQIIMTNQVLESYGNAMTVRNSNSSRFGKWIDLHFDKQSAGLIGCSMTNYLLETTRVAGVAPKERGFHIFFQLIKAKASGNAILDDLPIRGTQDYRYLRGSEVTAGQINDVKCFQELCEGLAALNFSEDLQKELFGITLGVLALGNCEFVEGSENDSSSLKDRGPLEECSKLLGFSIEQLERCLVKRSFVVCGEVTEANLKPEQADFARDSVARYLYGKVFNWLFQRVNSTLKSQDRPSDAEEMLLGVLDIAGFEHFEKNSLEQLMINLSNEHLQAHFNKVVFQEELDESVEEGIPLPPDVGFSDNSQVLSLIAGRKGLCDILDETMTIPRNTAEAYVSKVGKEITNNPQLIVSKIAKLGFGIKHFAGEVHYNCEGWLEKNANKVSDDITNCIRDSDLTIWKEESAQEPQQPPHEESPQRRAGGKGGSASVSSEFRSCLQALMTKISAREPHFIRCIKPNAAKVPRKMESKAVLEQLLFSGVLAMVKIRQQGYAYRLLINEFCLTYRCIFQGNDSKTMKLEASQDKCNKLFKAAIVEQPGSSNHRELCDLMLKSLPDCLREVLGESCKVDMAHFAVGKRKIFIKSEAFQALEKARRFILQIAVKKVQRTLRGRWLRRSIVDKKALWGDIRRLLALQSMGSSAPADTARSLSGSTWEGDSCLSHFGSLEAMQEALKGLEGLLQKAKEMDLQNGDTLVANKVARRLKLEIEAIQEVEKLMAEDAEHDLLTMEKAYAKATSMGLAKDLKATESLETLIQGVKKKPSGGAQENEEEANDSNKEAGGQDADQQQEGEVSGSGAAAARKKSAVGVGPAAAQEGGRQRKSVSISQSMEGQGAEEDEADSSDDDEIVDEENHLTRKQVELLRGMSVARRSLDIATLERLLRKAQDDEILMAATGAKTTLEDEECSDELTDLKEGEGEIAGATRILMKLQDVDCIMKAIDATREKASQADPSPWTLWRLENLTRQMKSKSGYDEETDSAKQSLASGLARRLSRHGNLALGRRSVTAGQRPRASVVQAPALTEQKGGDGEGEVTVDGGDSAAPALSSTAPPGEDMAGLASLLDFGDGGEAAAIIAKATGYPPHGGPRGPAPAPAAGSGSRNSRATAKKLRSPSFKEALDTAEAEAQAQAEAEAEELQRQQEQDRAAQEEDLEIHSGDEHDDEDEEGDLDLSGDDTAFDLSNFCDLKSCWRKRCDQDVGPLRFSKATLRSSLTRKPKDNAIRVEPYDALACQNFQNILICMGDKPRSSLQRNAAREAVVNLPLTHPELSAEVYMQVMKQLIRNPTRPSNRFGWELLLALCLHAPPDPEGPVEDCVRAFLTRGDGRPERLPFPGSGLTSLARACISATNSGLDETAKEHPSPEAAGEEVQEEEGEHPSHSERGRVESMLIDPVIPRRKNLSTKGHTARHSARPSAKSPWVKDEHEGVCGTSLTQVEFTAPRGTEKLGLSLPYVPRQALVVKKVIPRTWAYRQGLQVGDVVIGINNYIVSELSEDMYQAMMRSRPLKLTLDLEATDKARAAKVIA